MIQFRFYWPVATTVVITMYLGKFLTLDGFPISRKCFADNCSLAIRYCGLDPFRYKGYSFRIGAAFWITDQSLSHTQIRLLVCWNPNVFQKHIGVSSLSSVYLVYTVKFAHTFTGLKCYFKLDLLFLRFQILLINKRF